MQTLKQNFVWSSKAIRLFFPYFLFGLLMFSFSNFAATAQNRSKGLNYLFESRTEGYSTFRIPALLTTTNGTILAFAEGRKHGSSDTGDIDLVLKRSEDNGRTWSKIYADKDFRKNMTLRLGMDNGATWPKSKVLFAGPAAYSDLTALANGNIGCLYEAGLDNPYQGIVFEEISVEDFDD